MLASRRTLTLLASLRSWRDVILSRASNILHELGLLDI